MITVEPVRPSRQGMVIELETGLNRGMLMNYGGRLARMTRSQLVLIVLCAVFVVPHSLTTATQIDTSGDATPGTTGARTSPPPARELLLQAAVREMPARPVMIRLRRLTLPPAASLPPTVKPGFVFAVVDDGRVDIVVDGPAVVVITADSGEAVSEPLRESTATTLGKGDQVAVGADTAWSVSNRGSEPATIFVADISDDAKFASGHATPPPSGEANIATFQVLGLGRIESAPGGRIAITLERFNLREGIGMPSYSGPVLLAVESGGFSTVVDAGSVQLSEGGRRAVPLAMDGGGQVVVRLGDALVFADGMEATTPLQGEGQVSLLRLGILPLRTEAPAAGFPVGTIVVVTERDVQLRAAPSLSSEVVAVLSRRQRLMITGALVVEDDRTWYPVQDEQDASIAGYVAADFLREREQRADANESP